MSDMVFDQRQLSLALSLAQDIWDFGVINREKDIERETALTGIHRWKWKWDLYELKDN
jgi:hypothetical protein